MNETQATPAPKYNTAADIPNVEIRGYWVEMEKSPGIWLKCGERYWESIPDVAVAEEMLNLLRDAHPDRNYRMIRELVIIEVVHA